MKTYTRPEDAPRGADGGPPNGWTWSLLESHAAGPADGVVSEYHPAVMESTHGAWDEDKPAVPLYALGRAPADATLARLASLFGCEVGEVEERAASRQKSATALRLQYFALSNAMDDVAVVLGCDAEDMSDAARGATAALDILRRLVTHANPDNPNPPTEPEDIERYLRSMLDGAAETSQNRLRAELGVLVRAHGWKPGGEPRTAADKACAWYYRQGWSADA